MDLCPPRDPKLALRMTKREGLVFEMDWPQGPSLPDRNFVLGRMDGENAVEEGKRRERASKQEEIVPSRRQKPFEEDDHQFIRPIMRTMGPTSQGIVSAFTCVSTRNPGVCRSIDYPIRQGRDASGSRSSKEESEQ